MRCNKIWTFALLSLLMLGTLPAHATVNISEDFTGSSTQNSWYYFGTACLTAGDMNAGTGSNSYGPGSPPGCNAIDGISKTNGGYGGETLVGGYSGTLPDTVGDGALRFSNGCYESGCGSGYKEHGGIVSGSSFSTNEGLDITFKTVTYDGDSGGGGGDGADGMSFFLVDASQWSPTPTADAIGAYGGSLGYTCSNENSPYHGIVGGYLAVGIDEYGNFLDGYQNTLGETGTLPQPSYESQYHDNTASGGLYMPDRIGLRGAGSIAWSWLNQTDPTDYPSGLSSSQQTAAVVNTCETGYLWDYSQVAGGGKAEQTSTTVADYNAIPSAYAVLPSQNPIAVEYHDGVITRLKATPITYRVRITSNGLLSFWYSYNGGSWIGVIKNQDITADNGPLPSALRFGFAGSTGGSTNIHELLCFKATPAAQSQSSSTVNQQQSSRVQSGSQVYFSYYDPSNWTGDLASFGLSTSSTGVLSINSSAFWDASCNLTGVANGSTCGSTGQAGPISPQSPTSRVMLTWNGSAGVPFEWLKLTTADKAYLGTNYGQQRLDFLRGDRSNEINTQNLGLFRDRSGLLGDIVDSSPAWVGPPSKTIYSAYETPATWRDKLNPTTTMPENLGQSYAAYATAEASRLNVVYVGANDGFLHGFAAGSYDSTDTTFNSTTNTGAEVLAYMPQAVLADIHNTSNANLDYSNPQYGHNFYVDSSPGVGDLYYNKAWHTWLVSGLGAGGADIFALDITHPSNFSETNAASLVIGDWTPASLTCKNVSSCGSDLGDTYGTPVIRRLHNGDWGIIFGNGLNSSTGDAGIYVMTVDQSTGAITTYYLSTGESGTNDGIAYVAPVDMDGDHITDYVYAGDVKGNVWRFDLTSNSPTSWAVTPGPIFTTPNGQPITTAVQPAFITNPITNATQLMLYFGTGEKFPLTNSTGTSYASGTQSFYGVWDWNMDKWNSNASTQFASLSATTTSGLLSSSGTSTILAATNLQQQVISTDSSGNRIISSTSTICWAGSSACSANNNQFGWYFNLPGTNSGYQETTYEQDVFNPEIVGNAILFNSTLPSVDSPLACNPGQDQGWTYALDARTGGAVTSFFVNNGNTHTIAFESDASGTDSVVTTGSQGSSAVNTYLVYQTLLGQHGLQQINLPNYLSGQRETWVELR